MIAKGLVPTKLITLAKECTRCRVCFENDSTLLPGIVDLAQPPFVPNGYWISKPRVVIVGQNPGAGANRVDGADEEMRRHLKELREGDDTAWERYTAHCAADVSHWGQYPRYLKSIGVEPNEAVLANIAMCALLRDDQVTDQLFGTCADRYLQRWIDVLAADLIVLMGGRARSFRALVEAAAPRARVLGSMHYAVGGSHRARLDAELVKIKFVIADLRTSNAQLPHLAMADDAGGEGGEGER